MLTETPDQPTHDLAEISALIDAAVRLQNEPDPLLDLHADDVVVINIAGRRVMGRAELGAAMRGALASPLADVTTTVEIDDIRFVRPDVAVVSCTKHVHDGRANSDEPTSDGRCDELRRRGQRRSLADRARTDHPDRDMIGRWLTTHRGTRRIPR